MSNFIIIESFHLDYAICALSDGHKILDIIYHFGDNKNEVHNVYSGVVASNVESLSAYFVNYGAERNGFLPYALAKDKLSVNDKVIVQIVKAAKGTKGAKLSQFIKLYDYNDQTAFCPYGNPRNVNAGDENHAQYKNWVEILAHHKDNKRLLYQAKNAIEKFILKYKQCINAVYIDAYQPERIVQLCGELGLARDVIQVNQETVSLFHLHNLEIDLQNTLSNSVRLASGGEIVISQAEAMVAIDINSASCKDKDLESTILLVNIEAAEEIARQIRLRNLSGIIVIDFIDMASPNSRNIIESTFTKHMSGDHALHRISQINDFGLLMMSRQGQDVSVGHSIYNWCTHCGVGQKNAYHVVRDILSEIRLSIHSYPKNHEVEVRCKQHIYEMLWNEYKYQLLHFEKKYNVCIKLYMSHDDEYQVMPRGRYVRPANQQTGIIDQGVANIPKPRKITYPRAYNIQINDEMLLMYGLYK